MVGVMGMGKIKWAWLMGIVGLMMVLTGAAYPEIILEMADPAGDDYGYGTYQYPTNMAFQPYQGHFDILNFKVWRENEETIYFDTRFGKITNPWMAPEGFIHQNLRIYIDTRPNQGSTAPAKRGANIMFHPKFGWEVCLKIVGWGNSQLMILEDGVLKLRSLKTEVLADGQTIRAAVPVSILGVPDKGWNYYVLVGSYDGFGEDFFRKVAAQPGAWVFGGGADEGIEPRIIDILAPSGGPRRQEKQLASFNEKERQLAVVYPVSARTGQRDWLRYMGLIMGGLLLGGAGYWFVFKSRRLSWFWVKSAKNGNT